MIGKIPPTFIEKEPEPPPPAEWFQMCPVQNIRVDDLVIHHEVVFRVKEHRHRANTPRHHFALWPVLGGRPESFMFYSREWIPAYRPSSTE